MVPFSKCVAATLGDSKVVMERGCTRAPCEDRWYYEILFCILTVWQDVNAMVLNMVPGDANVITSRDLAQLPRAQMS